jgi:hypothetical protein
MVSYYSPISMFPHTAGRPGPAPADAPNSHPTNPTTRNHTPTDQNSNLQLAYAGSFGAEFSGHGAPWGHSAWGSPSFPGSCRSSYDWPGLEQGAPPPASAPATPPSDPALPSPTSPASPRPAASQSPAPSVDYHYKPALSPPQYKAEPSSTSELGPLGPGDLSEDCPSPSSLSSSRPQPARSPYEWMKKPAYPSPTTHDPNGEPTLPSPRGILPAAGGGCAVQCSAVQCSAVAGSPGRVILNRRRPGGCSGPPRLSIAWDPDP